MADDRPPASTTCARCGASFACTPEGDCWCMALPPRLPVPDGPATCLCPRCLDQDDIEPHRLDI
jgi:hypothetical protein